ncbi:MAG: copper chaperone PCu(A)C [Betaproteobacteria bacterium]|nr:copper chaperone PCu(A)C [Betaproteobacteria bacterium]
MRYAIAIAAWLCAAQAWAGDVAVSGAWARATAPGQEDAAMQFSITSKQEAQLVAISSPAAGAVELHRMTHDSGVMKMRAIESLPLPAGKAVDLAASGIHVMLLNLKQPAKAGESIPFTVTVQFADKHKTTVQATAEVKPLADNHDEHEHHH